MSASIRDHLPHLLFMSNTLPGPRTLVRIRESRAAAARGIPAWDVIVKDIDAKRGRHAFSVISHPHERAKPSAADPPLTPELRVQIEAAFLAAQWALHPKNRDQGAAALAGRRIQNARLAIRRATLA